MTDADRARWVRGRGAHWRPASPDVALAAIRRMRAMVTAAQSRNTLTRRY